MGSTHLTVTPEESKTRLDHFLSHRLPDLTRSRLKKLIGEGHILVDGVSTKAGAMLRAGNVVTVQVPALQPSDVMPEAIPLSILHEDSDLIVIDKAPHMVVHPAHGHSTGTLVNALLHHCLDLSGIGGVMRPGIVHRLDKGTSGVMVAAKNDAAHHCLSAQFKDHTIGRVYLAAVRGELKEDRGRIEKPLARHSRNRKKIAVRESGRSAVTDYEVLGRRNGISLVRLVPGTGRTHQLRVHLASSGHPILGDVTYGGGVQSLHQKSSEGKALLRALRRPALHALKLEFDHPSTHLRLSFESPPPEDLSGLFQWIVGGTL
ncbi:MAG: RluA family pseudouridine synthase [bacterium]|nr:RluA family pseudouridine synthase [bacterium]MDT8366451.1 RluA family pseudouridine synthase [bacterium]